MFFINETLLCFVPFPNEATARIMEVTLYFVQAKRLHDYVGNYRIPPELTSSVNPLLILILIPLFDLVIYPLFERFKLMTSSTSRMTVGMLFAVMAFIIYGCLNMHVRMLR